MRSYYWLPIVTFQFTLREGSDLTATLALVDMMRVSIHAPVKGATRTRARSEVGKPVSIHAPVKGATTQQGKDINYEAFQFTLP